jgi:hypothetical protein
LGIDGKYRPLVGQRFFLLLILAALTVEPALAQTRSESASDNVRRRQVERDQQRSPYWDGFILKQQGNCGEAITKLAPLAKRGFGYEDAQTALGECYLQLSGLDGTGGTAPDRQATFDKQEFTTGLEWIGKAARAGHFGAQAVMVSLYAAGLGPDEDVIEGAKWAHLYLTNPRRLNLGAPIAAVVSIDQLRESMDKTSWLVGKERARNWVPLYDDKAPQLPGN